jgi:hypothetical protein
MKLNNIEYLGTLMGSVDEGGESERCSETQRKICFMKTKEDSVSNCWDVKIRFKIHCYIWPDALVTLTIHWCLIAGGNESLGWVEESPYIL